MTFTLQLIFVCVVVLSVLMFSWVCKRLCDVRPKGWELAMLGGGVAAYFGGQELRIAAEGAALVIIGYFVARVVATSVYEGMIAGGATDDTLQGSVNTNTELNAFEDTNSTTLELYRVKSVPDAERKYDIYVDNECVGTIAPGDRRLIPLRPGPHEISLKLDWGSSNKLGVDAKRGVPMKAICGSSLMGIRILLFLLYMSIWRHNYIWIELAKGSTSSGNTR